MLLLVAAGLALGMLALLWPGVAPYDAIDQYRQALSGSFDDWHPPAMARLWALLLHIAPGQGPLLAVQLLLYWLGLGLIAGALARQGAVCAGMAVLALGALPLFAAWEADVLKDTQMLSAMLAACGIASWWRIGGRRMPGWGVAVIVILLAYAAFVRANGVFAVVPLAFGLFDVLEGRRPWVRAGAMLAAMAAFAALAPVVNQRVLGASPSGVERTIAVYDLGGIAHFAGPDAVPVLPAADWREAERRACYKPFFWDPYGDESRCGFVHDLLVERAPGHALFAAWAIAVLHHPIAYAEHRAAHLNSTLRWIVPAHWPFASPVPLTESNTFGLESPGTAGVTLIDVADWLTEGPEGSPGLWLVAALGAFWAAWPRADGRQQLAFALAGSAIVIEASFACVSIASDLRYHLWSMMAAGLAWVFLARPEVRRLPLRVTLAALLLLAVPAFVGRLLLPPAADSYAAALG